MARFILHWTPRAALLLCVLVIVQWIRDADTHLGWVHDSVDASTRTVEEQRAGLFFGDGRLTIGYGRSIDDFGPNDRDFEKTATGNHFGWYRGAGWWMYADPHYYSPYKFGYGFGYERGEKIPNHFSNRARRWIVTVPCWFGTCFLASIASLPLIARKIKRMRQARLERLIESGLCPNCGYDLRATPRRCPECGQHNYLARLPDLEKRVSH